MSVRSLRAAVRRTPVLVGAAALSVSLLAGCGEDTVDDGAEQEVDEEVEDLESED